jgi:hypothetical protein
MIPNASGKDAAGGPLRDAAGEHHGERRRDGRDDGPDAEHDEHRDEEPLLAVHVAEPPDQGVAIEALSRYAVSTQLTESTEACSACWMSGSAGATRDCSSAYEIAASASSAKVTL